MLFDKNIDEIVEEILKTVPPDRLRDIMTTFDKMENRGVMYDDYMNGDVCEPNCDIVYKSAPIKFSGNVTSSIIIPKVKIEKDFASSNECQYADAA